MERKNVSTVTSCPSYSSGCDVSGTPGGDPFGLKDELIRLLKISLGNHNTSGSDLTGYNDNVMITTYCFAHIHFLC